MPRLALALALSVAAALAVTACVPQTSGATGPSNAVTVAATADRCTLSADSAPTGTLTFTVHNDGAQVTEFYLLAEDGLQVVGEVENIGPGLSRDLVVQARPGSYHASCKPGMIGDGIRTTFTVTGSGPSTGPTGPVADQLDAAQSSYVAYVRDQVGALVTGTTAFADAYRSGDDATARSLYASTRVHWERVEPVAESFGDLDPLLDQREADLTAGQAWTGWHLIEKDLWPPTGQAGGAATSSPLTPQQRATAADDLVAHTAELHARVTASDFTVAPFAIANGAKELLDEVATGKVTGEEEAWSHTDLWDFAANVDGARVAYQVLADVVHQKDPALAGTLEARFAALDALLATHGSIGSGFVGYDELSSDQVRALAAAVDALAEPLSELTATVTPA